MRNFITTLALLIPLVLSSSTFAQSSAENPFLIDFEPQTAELPENTESYSKPGGEATVTVNVDAGNSLAKVSPYLFGNNLNPYIGNIHTESTLIEHVQKLSPNILRLPGGNLSNVFFWDSSPGDLPPGVPDSLVDGNSGEKYDFTPWHGSGSWSLDLKGFYEFIDKTSSTPIISVNYSYVRYGKTEHPVQQAAHYAAEWVRYDNGRTKYWEIGNENGGSWQAGYLIDTETNKDGQPRRINGGVYGRHAKVFIDSMRAAAEEIGHEIYIGTQVHVQEPADWDNVAQDWNQRYFEEAGDIADFFIEHNYYTNHNEDSNPPHIFNSVENQFGSVTNYYPEQIEEYGAEPKPLALTEWNIFATGSKQMNSNINGLHTSMVLGEMAEKPFYGGAMRWDLGNGYENGNDHGMFKVEKSDDPPVGVPKWNPRPDYFHMYYFQKIFGDHAVQTEVSGSNDVVAFGSTYKSGEAGIVVINTGESSETVEINLSNFAKGDRYYHYDLVGGDDNPPFSQRVFVNGTEPDHDTGGPIGQLGNIPARTTSADGSIKVESVSRSAQYILVESPASDIQSQSERPGKYRLKPNYPNPFNPSTRIEYSLPSAGHVSVNVYDMTGKHIRTLVDDTRAAGNHQVTWGGSNAKDKNVSSGVYLYKMEAGHFSQTRKMTLIK